MTRVKPPNPPRLWEWLLAGVCRSEWRDGVVGDLREEFEVFAVPALGERRARRWYARQVLASVGPLFARRLAFARRLGARRRPRKPTATRSGRRNMIAALWYDARHAVRSARRAPAFSVVVVIMLAAGIGANTAIFTLVNTVLLDPLPYPAPQELVRIREVSRDNPGNVSPQNFLDWHARNRTFAEMAAFTASGHATVRTPSGPERVRRALATPDLFDVLRTEMERGRPFVESDGEVGQPPVAIVTHRFWQNRMGGADILGQTLDIDGDAHEIVGVLPADFRFLDSPAYDEPELWIALQITERMGRGGHWLQAIGRMAPGVNIEQAASEADAIALALEKEYPGSNTGRGILLEPLHESLVGESRPALLVFTIAVGLVLLITCLNVANLLLVRGAGRGREMAVRSALGAGRRRILRQLLTESLLYAAAGGTLGVLIALAATRGLGWMAGADLPRADQVTVDGTVLTFAIVLTAVTGLLFGLFPAFSATATDLAAALRDGGRSHTGGPGGTRLRAVLVVGEVAVTAVLLIGSGLLIRSFEQLAGVDPGIDPKGVVAIEVVLPDDPYDSPARVGAYYQDLLARVRKVPGVVAAGAVNNLPFKFDSCDGFYADDRPRPAPGEGTCAYNQLATPGYLEAVGIGLRAGRTITDADRADTPPVILVNQTLVDRFWPGQTGVGKRITYSRVSREIVGVFTSVRRRGVGLDPEPEMIIPHQQDAWDGQMFITVRSTLDPAAVVAQLRTLVRENDPNVPIGMIHPMSELVAATYAAPRFRAALVSAFGLAGLVLSIVGVYSVMAYAVADRTQELGVRVALGASSATVVRLVLKSAAGIGAAGLTIGVGLALALSNLLEGLLFGVTTADPVTFVVVPVVLATAVALAGLLPARRAASVDPVIALRRE